MVNFRSNDSGLFTVTTANATYKLVLGKVGIPFVGASLTLTPPVPFAHSVVVPVPNKLTTLLVANYGTGLV